MSEEPPKPPAPITRILAWIGGVTAIVVAIGVLRAAAVTTFPELFKPSEPEISADAPPIETALASPQDAGADEPSSTEQPPPIASREAIAEPKQPTVETVENHPAPATERDRLATPSSNTPESSTRSAPSGFGTASPSAGGSQSQFVATDGPFRGQVVVVQNGPAIPGFPPPPTGNWWCVIDLPPEGPPVQACFTLNQAGVCSCPRYAPGTFRGPGTGQVVGSYPGHVYTGGP